jgi:hypothetical protein
MRLLRRKRAEPEPAIVISADAGISPERLEALKKGVAAAMGGGDEREVGEPDPAKRTVDRAPNGQWTTLKRM